jgi:hypothetical protein
MLVPLENIPTKKAWSNKKRAKNVWKDTIKMLLAMNRVLNAVLASTW